MAEKSYLYAVHPKRAITGLEGVKVLRTAKSLLLTKEDVKICLQKASVYRRFAAEGKIERVTIGNIDRLHNDNYISEEDWAKMDKDKAVEIKEDKRGTVVPGTDEVKAEPVQEPVKEESKQVEAPAKLDDAKVEETENESQAVPVEESVVVKDEVEDAPVSEEANEESEVAEDGEDAQAETQTNDEESDDAPIPDQRQNNGNQQIKYNNKKHKKQNNYA